MAFKPTSQQAVRFEVDPQNRLVAISAKKSKALPRFRTVLDGEFKSESNVITYHIKNPSGSVFPQKIVLSGTYSIDKNHNIVIKLDGESGSAQNRQLVIKTGILSVTDSGILFSVNTKDALGTRRIYTLAFEGRWCADDNNRLAFKLSKTNGAEDELLFIGTWEIGQFNELSYSYSKRILKKSTPVVHQLIFKGRWDITEHCRIIYAVNKEIGSSFEFKAGIGIPAKRGIKYQLSIGATPRKKSIFIEGAWRIDEAFRVIFSVLSESGYVQEMVFGADVKLKGSYVMFSLKNSRDQGIGIELKVSRNIFGEDGEAFLRALKSGRELSIQAGAGFRW